MKHILALSFAVITLTSYGQKKKKQDIEAIKDMCGCYEIKFQFAETFSPNKDYTFHDRYTSGALEWVFPVEESKDKVILQHLLVISDTMIIKHWRQDWLYENTGFYGFHKDRTWNYSAKTADEVKGQWTQKVYQVDDSPRYEGSATWIHADGKHYWESITDAPLPRREFSKRKDYNVMTRKNRQEITDYGWVHEQDNAKVLRENSKDEILAYEKGMNVYKKVEDSKCQPAMKWWDKNNVYWADVRLVWDELFDAKQQVKIKGKVDGKILFMRLFALGDEASQDTTYNSGTTRDKIRGIIQSYLNSNQLLTAKN